MSGEMIVVHGATKTLESSGGSVANNALLQATNNYDSMLAAEGNGYPDALFVLTCTMSAAPAENSVIALYAQPLAVDGTNNSEVPEASRVTRFIGTFVMNNVTSLQVMELLATDVPRKANYYLHNNSTGVAVNTGWQLRVIPRTYKPAP